MLHLYKRGSGGTQEAAALPPPFLQGMLDAAHLPKISRLLERKVGAGETKNPQDCSFGERPRFLLWPSMWPVPGKERKRWGWLGQRRTFFCHRQGSLADPGKRQAPPPPSLPPSQPA
ncbi:UNVERIFIED_CONTAM: hypothetical protein K2H54_002296 [Gekko kuhli]